jgi:long-chain fatty acid transport protein
MNYKKLALTALLTPLIAIGSGEAGKAHAAGYAVFTQGASALGQGNAVTAHADSPNAIFYNPALINKLEGTQLQVGTTAIFSSREFTSSVTGDNTSSDTTFFPSTFYVTHKFNDTVSAGLGVFNPFGLGTEWDDDWEGRYIATDSELTTFNINPVISYQILPSLSIAAGLDIILLDATLERKVPVAALPAPLQPAFGAADLGSKFKGDGEGIGWNLALAYDITKDLTFGASYRSEVHVDVSGDATFSHDTGPASLLNASGDTDLTLPRQVTAGLAYKGIDNLTLEAGVRWEGWSDFEKLTITLDNGQVIETPRNWRNTWGLNVGGKYQVTDSVALLAGYVWGEAAAPDSTFDPSIPDSDTHVFCLGTDIKSGPLNVALSYAYQLYEDRTKDNAIGASPLPTTAANGEYENYAHLVALSLGYQF